MTSNTTIVRGCGQGVHTICGTVAGCALHNPYMYGIDQNADKTRGRTWTVRPLGIRKRWNRSGNTPCCASRSTAHQGRVSRRFGMLRRMLTVASIGDVFKPGATVEHSGIYLVTHDTTHTQPHEVTCVFGKKFPPCRGCSHPRFKLVRAAQHIESNDNFKS